MTDNTQNPPAVHSPSQRGSRVDGIRRRLLKGGASAAPLIWAVTTRPAVAATTAPCTTCSGFDSMSSSRSGKMQVCSGVGPSYWQQSAHFDKWPHPYYATSDANTGGSTATRFHVTGCGGGYFGTKTMLEVLQMNGQGGFADLGAHISAALLNAAGGMTPVLSVPQVVNLWNECSGRGYYEPTAGIRWTREQVVAYLKTTMPG